MFSFFVQTLGLALLRENKTLTTESGSKVIDRGQYVLWCPSQVLITVFPRHNGENVSPPTTDLRKGQ